MMESKLLVTWAWKVRRIDFKGSRKTFVKLYRYFMSSVLVVTLAYVLKMGKFFICKLYPKYM